eukprot:gene6729-13628_t
MSDNFDDDCGFKLSTDGLPAYQDTPLKILFTVLGGVSILACLYVCFSFYFSKQRPPLLDPSAMIFFLAISDFFISVDFVVEGMSSLFVKQYCSRELCFLRAAGSQFFSLSSFLWTASMSHSSYLAVKNLFQQWNQSRTQAIPAWKLMIGYHIFCWGISALAVALSLASGPDIGSISSKSCWVVNDNIPAKVMLYLLPMILVEGYNIFVFQFIGRTLQRLPTDGADRLFRRFRRYLIVVIWTRGMFLINRGQNLFSHGGKELFALTLLASLGAPLQGLGNAIIFRDSITTNINTTPTMTVDSSGGNSAYSHQHRTGRFSIFSQIFGEFSFTKSYSRLSRNSSRCPSLSGGTEDTHTGDGDGDGDGDGQPSHSNGPDEGRGLGLGLGSGHFSVCLGDSGLKTMTNNVNDVQIQLQHHHHHLHSPLSLTDSDDELKFSAPNSPSDTNIGTPDGGMAFSPLHDRDPEMGYDIDDDNEPPQGSSNAASVDCP